MSMTWIVTLAVAAAFALWTVAPALAQTPSGQPAPATQPADAAKPADIKTDKDKAEKKDTKAGNKGAKKQPRKAGGDKGTSGAPQQSNKGGKKHDTPYLLIRHRVASYRKWKGVFDAHGPTRKAHGCKGGPFFRGASDPHELVIMLRWNDLDGAQQFATSDDFREMMARAGVSDMPDVYFLEKMGTTAQ